MNVPESHTRHRALKSRAALSAARRALHTLTDCLAAARAESLDLGELRKAESTLERYCELTIAVTPAFVVNQETPASLAFTRLTALQHLAGRRDEDLACAARCLSRIGERKLQNHARGARVALLLDCALLQHAVAALPSQNSIHELHRSPHIAHKGLACEALLNFHIYIIELASHLDDHLTAVEISRFRDAECARLRRMSGSGKFAAAANDARDFSRRAPDCIAHR